MGQTVDPKDQEVSGCPAYPQHWPGALVLSCVVGLCPVVRQQGGGSLGTGNSWVLWGKSMWPAKPIGFELWSPGKPMQGPLNALLEAQTGVL